MLQMAQDVRDQDDFNPFTAGNQNMRRVSSTEAEQNYVT